MPISAGSLVLRNVPTIILRCGEVKPHEIRKQECVARGLPCAIAHMESIGAIGAAAGSSHCRFCHVLLLLLLLLQILGRGGEPEVPRRL